MPNTVDIPLITEPSQDDKPKLPESRVRDGWHGHAIYRKLERDDSDAEAARAAIDFQIDGGLPYPKEVMREAGRGEDANVNLGEAKAEDSAAQNPFIEMGTVSQKLWQIDTKFGNENDRAQWSTTISTKFSEQVRKWGAGFDYFRLRLAQQFTRHGWGFAYWEDEINWKWRSDGPGAFKLQRDTESYAEAIDYCICKRSLTVTQLYKFIRNEDRVKEVGHWNVDAVKLALRRAAVSSTGGLENYSWEDFQRQIKENDIELGARAEKIQVYHLWVCEYDGRISHYVGLQDGVATVNGTVFPPRPEDEADKKGDMIGNGFLYAHRFRFPKFESAIVPFFYEIGTHATAHTVRAQGATNFGPISISNRAWCNFIDCVKAASMIVMAADTPADAENFAYIQRGAFMVYSGGSTKVVPTAMPDVSGRFQPLMEKLEGLRAKLSPTGIASGQQKDKSKQPDTKYGTQAKQNQSGALSSAILTQWFGPFGRLGDEMYRRMMNPKLREDDPGGKEAFEFRAACMAEGVPAEAMRYENCTVEAVRVIGNGSPEQRQYTSEQIWEMADAFDEVGRHDALVEVLTSKPGMSWQRAVHFAGPLKPRQPVDEQIANGENSMFTLGAKAKVTGEQNHWVHCRVHSELVKETADGFDQGTIDGPTLVKILTPALDNMQAHSEFLSKDKTREKEAAWVRKFLQNNNGTLEQQENKLVAEMQRQQEQQGQQGNGAQPPNPEEQRKSELHQTEIAAKQQEIQNRQREFEQRLATESQIARQKMTIADLKAAQETAREAAELASTEP